MGVQSLGDLWEVLKAWIECFFDTIKVLYSLLTMILTPGAFSTFAQWMPSLIFSVMSISLTLIVLLRVIGR